LDKNYPKKRRNKVYEIYLNEPSLEGELDLEDFTYETGVIIRISPQVDETKLTFKNQGENIKDIKLVNAQEWLESQEEYNTKTKREQITELDINAKRLEGKLNLNDFTSLEVLKCG